MTAQVTEAQMTVDSRTHVLLGNSVVNLMR